MVFANANIIFILHSKYHLLSINFTSKKYLKNSKKMLAIILRFVYNLKCLLAITKNKLDGPLAQLVEQLTLNQWVWSSSLQRSTIYDY